MARAKLKIASLATSIKQHPGVDVIVNTFDPQRPVGITVAGNCWETTYDGVHYYLDWSKLVFPDDVIDSLKTIARDRLKVNAPSDLKNISIALRGLSNNWNTSWVDFGDIGVDEWHEIWPKIRPGVRVLVRSIYANLAEADLAGADLFIADELSRWKARHNVRHLGYVLDWHPSRGALTASESELLRRKVSSAQPHETDEDECIRILTWTIVETLKRPRQLLLIELDGLKTVTASGITEYFLTIPKVKYQRAQQAEWWPIS